MRTFRLRKDMKKSKTKTLGLESSVDSHLKPVKDSDGNICPLELSTDKIRVKDIEVTGTATGITHTDDTKLPLAGGTMAGGILMGANSISNASSVTSTLDMNVQVSAEASGDKTLYIKALNAGSGDGIISLQATSISGTAIKDQDDMASDSDGHLASQQSIKAYVDAQVAAVKKIWSGNTYGTRCGTQDYWYIGAQSLGNSISAADFVDDSFEKNYYPFFIAPHACTIESIGIAGGVNYAGNNWEVEFWHVNYDNNDTAADAATKIGATISLSSVAANAMISSVETGLSVALAAGDCVFHVQRFTSGATSKTIYVNPTIGYK